MTFSRTLAALTLSTLVELHNNLADHADKPEVKSFRTKPVAVARVLGLLRDANDLRAADKLPLLDIVADGSLCCLEAPKPVAPAAPVAETPARAGKASRLSPTDVIVLAVAANPKKATAANRFALYRTGQTVAEYRAAVGSDIQASRDLNWDTKKGWVRLLSPEVYAAETVASA